VETVHHPRSSDARDEECTMHDGRLRENRGRISKANVDPRFNRITEYTAQLRFDQRLTRDGVEKLSRFGELSGVTNRVRRQNGEDPEWATGQQRSARAQCSVGLFPSVSGDENSGRELTWQLSALDIGEYGRRHGHGNYASSFELRSRLARGKVESKIDEEFG
jgi:hypothetical protein